MIRRLTGVSGAQVIVAVGAGAVSIDQWGPRVVVQSLGIVTARH